VKPDNIGLWQLTKALGCRTARTDAGTPGPSVSRDVNSDATSGVTSEDQGDEETADKSD